MSHTHFCCTDDTRQHISNAQVVWIYLIIRLKCFFFFLLNGFGYIHRPCFLSIYMGYAECIFGVIENIDREINNCWMYVGKVVDILAGYLVKAILFRMQIYIVMLFDVFLSYFMMQMI